MSEIGARIFYVVLGLALTLGSVAYGKISVDRGYFKGGSGAIYKRGESKYTFHLGLLGLAVCAGSGVALAGLMLPSGHRMLRS